MGNHNILIVRSLDGFLSLKNEWNALWEHSLQLLPYQRWEWNYHWMRTGSNFSHLYLVVVRGLSGELIGIAPFWQDRPFGFLAKLSFISQKHSVYPDFLIKMGHETEVVRSILEHLHRSGVDGLELVIAEPTATVDIVKSMGQVTGWTVLEPVNYTKRLIVNLSDGYDTYLARLTSKMRQEIRAEARKLEKLFTVEFSSSKSDADLNERMSVLFRLNALKWNADPERCHPERRECYRALSGSREATVFTLACNNKPIAALSALLIKGTLFAEIAGFDYSVAKVDIGKVFYHFLFQWAMLRGFNRIDLSSGEEPYKFRYNPDVSGKWRLTLYRNGNARSLLRLNAVYEKSISTLKRRIACSGVYRLLRGNDKAP